jgi:hypothetical protein
MTVNSISWLVAGHAWKANTVDTRSPSETMASQNANSSPIEILARICVVEGDRLAFRVQVAEEASWLCMGL